MSILEGLRQSLRPRGNMPPDDYTDLNEPSLPPSPLTMGAGPRPVEPTPGRGMSEVQGEPPSGLNQLPSGFGGDMQDFTADFGRAPFRPNELEGALGGLRSMASSQNIPGSSLGPTELNRLANRDPRSVAPGSNQLWQGQLQEEQARTKRFEQPENEMANAAIAGLHPAIQQGAELEAGRKSLPAQITGQMQLEASKVAGASRYGVGESARLGRNRTAKMGHMNAVMNAIRGIQGKANLQDTDLDAIEQLRTIYEDLDEEINANEDFEDASRFRFGGQ